MQSSLLQAQANKVSRRVLLTGGLCLLVLPLSGGGLEATPESMAEAMAEVLGKDASTTPGRVQVDLPELAENGNSVPLKISVDLPSHHHTTVASANRVYPEVVSLRVGH